MTCAEFRYPFRCISIKRKWHIIYVFHIARNPAVESDKFETIQFPYNIVENQADEVFKRAYEKGVGTIVMKPLAGGR